MGSAYYHSRHCFICPDFFAHLADISFGDAWLDECRHNKEGWSLCLARSNAGHELLLQLRDNQELHLNEITVETIKKAMMGNIVKKHRQQPAKARLCGQTAVTKTDQQDNIVKLKSQVEAWFRYLLSGVGQSRVLEHTLLSFPPNLFMRIAEKAQRLLSH